MKKHFAFIFFFKEFFIKVKYSLFFPIIVRKLIELQKDDTIWKYFPYLLAISVAFVVHELFKRYIKGEITKKRFRNLAIKATGIKASKFAGIFILLSIPDVNVATSIALIAKLIKDIRNTSENLLNKKGKKN